MAWKTASSRSRLDSLRAGIGKPKLSLFGSKDSDTLFASSSSQFPDLPWSEEKTPADAYVKVRITEQEMALAVVLQSIAATKRLVLSRIDGGNKMAFLVAYTQLRNAEANRDHLFGIIGQLEYLRKEIEDASEYFTWKSQCHEILRRKPLRFSVKDDEHHSFVSLKEEVRLYCLSFP